MKLKYNIEIDMIPNTNMLDKKYYLELFARRIKNSVYRDDDYNKINDVIIEILK